MGSIISFFKKLFSSEPVLVGWALNGGLVSVAAYLLKFGPSKTAAAATILSAIVAIATAILTKPPHVSLVSGGLVTLTAALGAWGLHFTPHTTAFVLTVASLLTGLLIRVHVTPAKKIIPVTKAA